MSQTIYDDLIARYNQAGFPEQIGEPGHFLITSLLSVWRERGYPEQFRIGNNDLALKCGSKPTNIGKLRDRVFGEVKFDNHQLLTYKSQQTRAGIYRVNSAVFSKTEVIEESEPVIKTPRQLKNKRWNTVPFLSSPKLQEGGSISQTQMEILNSFGLRHIRAIDRRYYTPSSEDTERLYELFRTMTPKVIKDLVKKAHKAGQENALVWIREGAGCETG